MYIPDSFLVIDPEIIRAFVDANGFGILVSTHDGNIDTTHTPMYLSDDSQYVYGHIARANPHWQSWSEGTIAKALFHGPHTYISPNDYVSQHNVPTWNYTAVSVDGTLEILEDQQDYVAILQHLIGQYESTRIAPWSMDASDNKVLRKVEGIVAFRIHITRIEATFKLNQNKSAEDQENVIERLRMRGGDMNEAIAALMSKNQTSPS